MVILKKFSSRELIFLEDYFIILNDEEAPQKTLKIPDPQVEQPQLSKSLEEILKPENKIIIAVCASRDDEFLAVVLQNRQLVIYDSDLNLVSNTLCKRAASKVVFTNCNDVLIADKTGDVYLYKFKEKTEPRLLLGHLSMLLDITMSECGKYVITSDRDEKIRVSRYPNAYNITSYCLGHREFVSHVVVIANDTLVSASGDGTIRFWDFVNGKEEFVLNTNDYMENKNVIETFKKEMDVENVYVDAVPIVDMQIFDKTIAVSLLGCNGIQLYYVNKCNGQIDVKLIQNLEIGSEITAFSLNSDLLIFTKMSLKRYKCDNEKFTEVSSTSIKELIVKGKESLSVVNKLSALYKRKYDNVQEYLERKKSRIENKA